jgi:hypothetical protein
MLRAAQVGCVSEHMQTPIAQREREYVVYTEPK